MYIKLCNPNLPRHGRKDRRVLTLISASRKNRRFSGLAVENPKGSKFFELGSGPSAPLRPPANSIDGVARTAVLAPREVSSEFEGDSAARAADGATKAWVEPTMARAEAANTVFILLLGLYGVSDPK